MASERSRKETLAFPRMQTNAKAPRVQKAPRSPAGLKVLDSARFSKESAECVQSGSKRRSTPTRFSPLGHDDRRTATDQEEGVALLQTSHPYATDAAARSFEEFRAALTSTAVDTACFLTQLERASSTLSSCASPAGLGHARSLASRELNILSRTILCKHRPSLHAAARPIERPRLLQRP